MTTTNKPSAPARFIMTRTLHRLEAKMAECQDAYIARLPHGDEWASYHARHAALRTALRDWA